MFYFADKFHIQTQKIKSPLYKAHNK